MTKRSEETYQIYEDGIVIRTKNKRIILQEVDGNFAVRFDSAGHYGKVNETERIKKTKLNTVCEEVIKNRVIKTTIMLKKESIENLIAAYTIYLRKNELE